MRQENFNSDDKLELYGKFKSIFYKIHPPRHSYATIKKNIM